MSLCYSICRHDLLKPEISKMFFAYRIRHLRDLKFDKEIQVFGISKYQQDYNNRKLSYNQVLDSVEDEDDVLEAIKLISDWPDVQILRDLIKERIENFASTINFEISKDKFQVIQDKLLKIRKMAAALYQIHYRRLDVKECYWDLQVIFCQLARFFIHRKDQLTPEIRKALFKTKYSILTILINLKDIGLTSDQIDMDKMTDPTTVNKCLLNLTEYFKELGYPKISKEGHQNFEDLRHIQILLKIVNFFHQA